MKFHEDDRAQRLIDVFDELPTGQINLSYVNSTEHITAWHTHAEQTDYMCCIKGSFKVGLAEIQDNKSHVSWRYLSDKNPQVLKIPPGISHGYKALEPNSIMLYYLSQKYNPHDEFRCSVGSFNEVWETENK